MKDVKEGSCYLYPNYNPQTTQWAEGLVFSPYYIEKVIKAGGT